MKYRSLVLVLQLISAMALTAGIQPLYINRDPVHSPPDVAPQINARAFVNLSTFEVNDDTIGLYALPFQTLNTLYFTNYNLMYGSPGFNWDYFSGNVRRRMSWWVNDGDVFSYNTNIYYSGLYATPATWLMVYATNVICRGTLGTDAQGLVRLDAHRLNLTRARLRSGAPLTQTIFGGGGYLLATNYFNDQGVYDYYWGLGSNNVMTGNGNRMPLNNPPGFTPSFTLPAPISPIHQVAYSLGYTSTVTVPTFQYGGLTNILTNFAYRPYNAVAYTNQIGNDRVVQAVFYPTNVGTNFETVVRFYRDDDNGATAIVGFHTVDTDPVLDVTYTNSVYLLDALAFRTNLALARNYQGNTRRPHTYEVTRSTPFEYSSFYSEAPNFPYSDALIYNPNYLSNAVPVLYTAYAALIQPFSFNTITGGASTLTDPTNYPGRVEVFGNQVNLQGARVRAENTFILKTDNLISNAFAKVNAPYINFDVGTTQPTLVISNFAAPFVSRFSGYLYAWSATWRNYETNANGTTNTIQFHVLMVDHALQAQQPVTMNRFAARATNGTVVINDRLNIGQSVHVTAETLDVKGSLTFPAGTSWGNTNMARIRNLTNSGEIRLTGSARLGTDRTSAYTAYINSGTNVAAGQFIRTERFENTGWIQAEGGPMNVTMAEGAVSGGPTVIFTNVVEWISFQNGQLVTNYVEQIITNAFGAALIAASDLQVSAESLSLSNAFLQAGSGSSRGTVILDVGDILTDGYPQANNQIVSATGVQLLSRPQFGELRNTHIWAKTPGSRTANFVWAGLDQGPVSQGFENNVAVGRLTLDGGANSFFIFRGAGAQSAIYVDYLELLGQASDYLNSIQIDPNIIIYFANANVPPAKLEERGDGRFRWVPSYTGPLSSTNIVYPDGTIYTFNVALVTDKDRDDDGDGIVNFEDPTPLFVPASVELQINRTRPGNSERVQLSWRAMPKSVSYVEYKPSLTATNTWQVLHVLTNQQKSAYQMSTNDVLQATQPQRVYRVMVVPPSL